MPLEIDAEVGGEDSNAYATDEEALAYAEYRVGGSAFAALTADQRIQALVTAARDIDTIGDDFIGERATDTQALEWPRSGTDYDDDELPTTLVNANIELAIAYVPAIAAGSTAGVLNPSGSGLVKRRKTDVLETEWFAARTADGEALEQFPDAVRRLLKDLVENTEDAWGSAEVSRGS